MCVGVVHDYADSLTMRTYSIVESTFFYFEKRWRKNAHLYNIAALCIIVKNAQTYCKLILITQTRTVNFALTYIYSGQPTLFISSLSLHRICMTFCRINIET